MLRAVRFQSAPSPGFVFPAAGHSFLLFRSLNLSLLLIAQVPPTSCSTSFSCLLRTLSPQQGSPGTQSVPHIPACGSKGAGKCGSVECEYSVSHILHAAGNQIQRK